MIFLDTSLAYAMVDSADRFHEDAVRLFRAAAAAPDPIITHNYVLVETASLLQRRAGLASALAFLADAEQVELHWVTPDLHLRAVNEWRTHSRRRLSLVDVVSFAVMRARGVTAYLGFDPDFDVEGFTRYQAP